MPNVHQKDETSKAGVSSKKFQIADTYSSVEKVQLVYIVDTRLISRYTLPRIERVFNLFFNALLSADFDMDKEYRCDLLSFFTSVNEFINHLKTWDKSDDHLVDIATDLLSVNHLEDADEWLDEMFRNYFVSEYLDGTDVASRSETLAIYEDLKTAFSELQQWHNTHHEERRKTLLHKREERISRLRKEAGHA